MRDRDGAFAFEQQHGHRLSHDVRLADDHGIKPAIIVDDAVQKHHAAERRAGDEAARAGRQSSDIDRVKAIDILARIDAVEHFAGIDLRGQGQLHQNAMHRVIGVEPVDQRQQFVFRRFCGHAVLNRADTDLAALRDLAADVDFAGGVVAHKHHGEAGRLAAVCHERANLRCRPFGQCGGHRLAIDDLCHVSPLRVVGTPERPYNENCMCCIQNRTPARQKKWAGRLPERPMEVWERMPERHPLGG